MKGRDHADPLLLPAKEAQASVLERFVGPSQYPNHGQRIVAGQHLMQAATDIFLGWQRLRDLDGQTRDYYVCQFHDWKGSVQVDMLRVPGATLYARLCGTARARAHARWGTGSRSRPTWAWATPSTGRSRTSLLYMRIYICRS